LHGVGIARALGFVEHQDVLGRDESGLRGVSADTVLHAAHEGLAVNAGAVRFVLPDLDERATEEIRFISLQTIVPASKPTPAGTV